MQTDTPAPAAAVEPINCVEWLRELARLHPEYAEAARVAEAVEAMRKALHSTLLIVAEWHDEFPDAVGDNEELVLAAARAAIAAAGGTP